MTRDRLQLLGCGFAVAAVPFTLGVLLVTQPITRATLIVFAVIVLITILVDVWRDARAIQDFRTRHGPGKDLLIVYSASPHWQNYIEQNWLSRWEARAISLNRSDPNWENSSSANLWRRLAGSSEHTPVAIVVPANGNPQVIRFYHAFRDHKHGKPLALQQKERELETALESSTGPG